VLYLVFRRSEEALLSNSRFSPVVKNSKNLEDVGNQFQWAEKRRTFMLSMRIKRSVQRLLDR
jgi:hypothetical protein